MQGVEHANKLMKQCLVAQCTAAGNNRRNSKGERVLGDVAQVAQGKVVVQHILDAPSSELPKSQYGQRMLGRLGWGTSEAHERVEKHEHKIFKAASSGNLSGLLRGAYTPLSEDEARLASPIVRVPEPMALLLSDPPRRRRRDVRAPFMDTTPLNTSPNKL